MLGCFIRNQLTSFGWRMWSTARYVHSSVSAGERHQATSEEIEHHRQLFQSLVQERAINNEIILTVGTSDYEVNY